MFASITLSRGLRIAALFALGLTLAACARGAEDIAGAGGFGAGGAGTPGSTQDFTVNVGDRVFFDTDSTDLNSSAIATLNQQAEWLNRYPRYTFLIEGSCRRAWHPRVQFRPRRPPGPDRARLSGLARRRCRSHARGLLRQGAPRRRLCRTGLLGPEPPRRDPARRVLQVRENRAASTHRRRSCPSPARIRSRPQGGPAFSRSGLP